MPQLACVVLQKIGEEDPEEGEMVDGDEHIRHQQEFLRDPTMPAHRSWDQQR